VRVVGRPLRGARRRASSLSHLPMPLTATFPGRVCSLLALTVLAGCGSGGYHVTVPPNAVPRDAVAIVGSVPITGMTFRHWLLIGMRDAGPYSRALGQAHTLSFLIKSQWLLQEATREGANVGTLDRLASRRAAQTVLHDGMTRSDAKVQATLDLITEALRVRHEHVTVTAATVSRYYDEHRSEFVNPAFRDTVMVVTSSRDAALRAKTALESGEGWAAVAARWSDDPSRAYGGAYSVVEGVQSPALVSAVFAARRGRVTGPVYAPTAARPQVEEYFLFKVTGEHRATQQSRSEVTNSIRQTVEEQAKTRALAAFTASYESHWRALTLCAPGYIVPECSNYHRPSTKSSK